jgi:hypothetical protein
MIVLTSPLLDKPGTAVAPPSSSATAGTLVASAAAGAAVGWGTGDVAWLLAGLGAAVVVGVAGSIRRARTPG